MTEQKKTCLVLEGGALRGVYTSGVQGVFHRAGLRFDALYGTSAGAMNGINYLSDQPERTFLIDYHFAQDKSFMGLGPLLREGQFFSFDYMFGAVNERYPLDYHRFATSPTRFTAVTTSLSSGKPTYFDRDSCTDIMRALQASASMPLLSSPVSLDGECFLDGGPSMSVAYRRPIELGYEKIVLVLTRHKGYRKRPLSPALRLSIRHRFRDYPAFCQCMLQAPLRYNAMMDEIDRLEAAGRLFVLRPSTSASVARTERDPRKLFALFLLGRRDAHKALAALSAYLGTEALPS